MHAYEHGRLDLPSVGHCTFANRPPCLERDTLDADVAVLVVPYDVGTHYRSGARFDLRSRLDSRYNRFGGAVELSRLRLP
jgi:agmatinase